jgi:alpha-glucosidase
MPWSGTATPFGFGATEAEPWLPMPPEWSALTVEAQSADQSSTLSFFRRMLQLRREVTAGLGDDVELLETPTDVLAMRRGDLVVVVNCGRRPAALPAEAGDLLLSSGADPVSGQLAPDTAAWFRSA